MTAWRALFSRDQHTPKSIGENRALELESTLQDVTVTVRWAVTKLLFFTWCLFALLEVWFRKVVPMLPNCASMDVAPGIPWRSVCSGRKNNNKMINKKRHHNHQHRISTRSSSSTATISLSLEHIAITFSVRQINF
jgi:hypothetical protein